MNYSELCKAVAGVHKNIEVAIVLSTGRLTASYIKSGGPAPDGEELNGMISQIETIIRTAKINEDKFGEMGFISIHYKYIDGFFFPINEYDALVVGVIQPNDHDSLVNKIIALVEQKRND